MANNSRNQYINELLQASNRLLHVEGSSQLLKSLPIKTSTAAQSGWISIKLPDWAADIAPNGKDGLLVPKWGDELTNWDNYDWWRGAYTMFTCSWEYEHEATRGPIHSYSTRLNSILQPLFDHAWVNRIILFLRRWYSFNLSLDESHVFGAIPSPRLHLTHDVDAIAKTLPIRIKQAAFCIYKQEFKRALRFLFGLGDYWQFDNIIRLENLHKRRSIWNVYGGSGGWMRHPKEILMDPSYNVNQPKLNTKLRELLQSGHVIGLHPKFDSWADAKCIEREKKYIEDAIGTKITVVRQHWLRFSFSDTWKAQSQAKLEHDMTLGFNDRTGFRNATALSFSQINSEICITPMVLMDSHLYDYAQMDEEGRRASIDHILLELKETGGEASIIWHQRVFHKDYNWGGGYAYLLMKMDELGFEID